LGLPTIAIGLWALLYATGGQAAAPILYGTPAYESPVRGEPGDLLLLPGSELDSGDTVVYAAIGDSTKPLQHPSKLPQTSTPVLGIAEVVSFGGAPYALTIHLSEAMSVDQSYALWVVNSAGEWSNGIKINDARPLWFTPDETFASGPLPGLPRQLKLVGRNLQHAAGVATQVRLAGPATSYRLAVIAKAPQDSAIDRYVAKVQLPEHMLAGVYSVQLSRDGVSWVPLLGDDPRAPRKFEVLPDRKALPKFPVGSFTFGTCDPGVGICAPAREVCTPDDADRLDQTRCIAAAVAAAHAAGGGVVVFGAGTYHMNDAGHWNSTANPSSRGVSHDGLAIPEGVSLEGAGSSATILVRGTSWNAQLPMFALRGHNVVSGFTFRDARIYASNDSGSPMLLLGAISDRVRARRENASKRVSHVIITQNLFDKPFRAIVNDGSAIDHLLITSNEFGAFKTAIFLEGNSSSIADRYSFSDSIISRNQFLPGSYLDVTIGQGAIATELSGGLRVDFSENVADGASTRYLYDPANDARGWRAAYFWSMTDNVEMMLVSQNSATCTGDKDGDGEAIAFDNNHNRPGFLNLAVPVLASSSDPSADTSTITVGGSLIDQQLFYGSRVDVRPVTQYYTGDWLQVVQGPGIGQARKIWTISTGGRTDDPTVTFTVKPAFAVLPQTNSLVTDGRLFWQTYTIDNIVDQRRPLCLKSNRTRSAGGLITLYASTIDSALEGNVQYDTSGILVAHEYMLTDPKGGVNYPSTLVQSSNEIRANIISGEYGSAGATPQAQKGIVLGYSATPNTSPPPSLSFGMAISHNTISRVAAVNGAISLRGNWFTGPESNVLRGVTPWKMAYATLIFRNALPDIEQAGVGIGLSAANPYTPIAWRSVLYDNACTGTNAIQNGIVDHGTASSLVCLGRPANSCECARRPTDLAITGVVRSPEAAVGQRVVFSLNVINRGPVSATGVTFLVEQSAELSVESMSGPGILCDTENRDINLCKLGTISAGGRRTITVLASIRKIGPGRIVFSIAHQEPDPNPRNDSLSITTIGRPAGVRQ